MIYLLLCIACSSLLYLIFKKFEQYKVNLLQAIVINYIVAGSLGFLLSFYLDNGKGIYEVSHAGWFYWVVVLGFMFISIFNLIGLSSQYAGVSVTSVANKLSVVLPVIFGFTFLNEEAGVGKILGILLALVALFLITGKKEKTSSNKKLFFLPVIIFFASGLLDILLSYCERNYVSAPLSVPFTGFIFAMAACFGIVFLTFMLIRGKQKIQVRNIVGGIVLGLPNFFSILFVFTGLKETQWPVTTFFPVCNIGVMVLTALIGWLVLREKLSRLNLFGIGLAVIAILLISFSDKLA